MHPKRLLPMAALMGVLIAPSFLSAQAPAGVEFRVNTATTMATQGDPDVAVGPDGSFVVVWHRQQPANDILAVYGQRYDAAGLPRGGELQVAVDTTVNQFLPAVAVDRRGNFAVVWHRQAGSGDVATARRFDANGAPLGLEITVGAAASVADPRLAFDRAGGFVVVWTGADGDGYGVLARLFDATGTPRGPGFVVNTTVAGPQGGADVALDAAGNFVVVWPSDPLNNASPDVQAQRFDASGARVGTEFRVNSYTTDQQAEPTVAMTAAGDFVVAWSGSSPLGDSSGAVVAQSFAASGARVGSELLVNAYTTGVQAQPRLALDTAGNFMVTWTSVLGFQDDDVFAARFDASGQRRGDEFRVNTDTARFQQDGRVATDGVGNAIVAWNGAWVSLHPTEVRAQRYGGLAPTALTVDAASNSVWEPGETVPVRPSWRNLSGSGQAFGGALTQLTGPAGASYTITDGAAAYGTVANGATASCTATGDCYAVGVDDPTPRPALHWDATAVETVTPAAQGQAKKWSLHVGRSFDDVSAASPFYRFVETVLHNGVTAGCGGRSYCPAASTTREQMAVFLLVAREGAAYQPPACAAPGPFPDVPETSPYCRWIAELVRRGVTAGCGGGGYCPSAAVSRQEMAVFVLATLDPALDPPACTAPLFNDLPASSPYCRWVEELARRGIVAGCGGGAFCGGSPVTREQMSVYLGATFGLTLYGP